MMNGKNKNLKIVRNSEGKITATVRKLWFLEFLHKVYDIYGFFLDCQHGFSLIDKELVRYQKEILRSNKITIEDLNKRSFIYGEGEPGRKGSFTKHISEQGKVRDRNKMNGENHKITANLCLVLIYQYWEDKYRKKIAIYNYGYACKNELNLDIFQDIRMIRRSIIHNNSIAIEDVEKNKYIKWFKKGDKIEFNAKQFDKIINLIFFSLLNSLPKEYEKYFPSLYRKTGCVVNIRLNQS